MSSINNNSSISTPLIAAPGTAPAADDGNTEAAAQQLSMQVLALMASLMTLSQNNSAPNMAVVQKAAQSVISTLPQGQNPQFLTDLAKPNSSATPDQIQSAVSALTTFAASMQVILPQTDPQPANNQYQHLAQGRNTV